MTAFTGGAVSKDAAELTECILFWSESDFTGGRCSWLASGRNVFLRRT
jgi:hypothetical protein